MSGCWLSPNLFQSSSNTSVFNQRLFIAWIISGNGTYWVSLIGGLDWTGMNKNWLAARYLHVEQNVPFDHFCDSRGLYNTYVHVLLSSNTSCTGNGLGRSPSLLTPCCFMHIQQHKYRHVHCYTAQTSISTQLTFSIYTGRQGRGKHGGQIVSSRRKQWQLAWIIYIQHSKVDLAIKCL